jgi:hypothetical protein
MVGNNLTMRSTALGMDAPIAQAKRRTVIQEKSENCGLYMIASL